MKQCPHCKKNIPDSAKICPHCGKQVVKGYQPMKRTTIKPNYLYILLAFFFIFSPLISTMMFGNMLDEAGGSGGFIGAPKDAITLGPLGKANIEKEEMLYYFDSLKEFKKLVTNSDKYVNNIKELENNLDEITKKYAYSKMSKEYAFYVTDQNNVYSELTYVISNNDDKLNIELSYDLSGKTNNLNMVQTREKIKDFESMKISPESYVMYQEIYRLISGNDEISSYESCAKKFNDLESKFNERQDTLGNYGLGVSDSKDKVKTSMRVLDGNDGYRFRLTSSGKVDIDELTK